MGIVLHASRPARWLTSLTARGRVVIAGGLGAVIAVPTTLLAPWQLSTLLAWDTAATWVVVSVWVTVGPLGPDQTRAFATREDNTRLGAHLLLVSASVSSLVGVGLDLAKASEAGGAEAVLLTVFGVLTVAVSWMVVHTVFALRYAHEYYSPPEGGIDFKMDEQPGYEDFAYVAFTVGMTFQVSDTDIQSSVIRRTVLRHALLSFLFGAVILAVTVNVIASILHT